jgi:hypothetical protein
MTAIRDAMKKAGADTRKLEAYSDSARHVQALGWAEFDAVVAQLRRDMGDASVAPRKTADVIGIQRAQPLRQDNMAQVPAVMRQGNTGAVNRAAAAAAATSTLEDVIWHTTRLCGRPLAHYNVHELMVVVDDRTRVLKATLFERRLAELLLEHAQPNEVTKVQRAVPTAKLREFLEEAARYEQHGLAALERLKDA